MSDVADRVAAVVVDFHAGSALATASTRCDANGVSDIVVVENGEEGSTTAVALRITTSTLVEPGLNLGYGRGVNRGVAAAPRASATCWSPIPTSWCTTVRSRRSCDFLDEHPDVGDRRPPDPSSRRQRLPLPARLPELLAGRTARAAGAAVARQPRDASLPLAPRRRHRWTGCRVRASSSRRDVFEEVGGFDERYFMFAEDMALCWQMREHGYGVAAVDEARRHPHRGPLARARPRATMLIAHHRSALRFEWQTAQRLATGPGAPRDAGARSSTLRGAGRSAPTA